MKAFFRSHVPDYRIVTLVTLLCAVVAGIIMERGMVRLTQETAETIFEEYMAVFSDDQNSFMTMLKYLLKAESKKYCVLFVLCFSVLGLPVNLYLLFSIIYRYAFLLSAMLRCESNGKIILCVSAMMLCFLLNAVAYLHRIKLSCKSLQYCSANGTRLYHCSKYQLQTEIKIGIIVLLYVVIAVMTETTICTGLFRKCFGN